MNSSLNCSLSNQTGKTLKIYKGHTGPLTALAFCGAKPGSSDGDILITGSWDKVNLCPVILDGLLTESKQTIMLWETQV